MTQSNADTKGIVERFAKFVADQGEEDGDVSADDWCLLVDVRHLITTLTAERDANGLEAHTLRGERDRARADAVKWLGLHDVQEARAEAAEARVKALTEALELIREEAFKDNAHLGRSDRLALDRIRTALNLIKEEGNGR